METAGSASVQTGLATLDFTEFFRTEYPGLVRALYLLTGSMGEAEELAQEAMARTYEQWERVMVMASPGAYVYRAAVNLNRKRLRHLAMRARRLLTLPRPRPSFSGAEERTELSEALAALSRQLRETFMLVEWLGLSAEEAGTTLGIKASSVRSRIHRARRLLSERLLREGEDSG